MHFFSVSTRKYCFDESLHQCFLVDMPSEIALRAWEDSGRILSASELADVLRREGFTEDTVDEIREDLEEYIALSAQELNKVTTPHKLCSLELHVSHSCNLGCSYCFAGKGDYGIPQRMMSRKVAFAAVDTLVSQSCPEDQLSIVFFGGEPLLNKSLIHDTVEYVRKSYPDRSFSFSITTNGTLLDDEIVSRFVKSSFSVLVSMDGIGDRHDSARPYKNGKGSYLDISCNIKKYCSTLPFGVRATLTKGNCDILSEYIEFIKIGFKKTYFSPVSSRSEKIMLDQCALDHIREQLEVLANMCVEELMEGKRPTFRSFWLPLAQIRNAALATVGCGAGRRFIAVTPNGDCYPCHRFVGMTAYKLGNVLTGVKTSGLSANWDKTVDKRSDCSKCWIRDYCGGGCEWEAADLNQLSDHSFFPSSCEYRRMCYEMAFDILSRLREGSNNAAS